MKNNINVNAKKVTQSPNVRGGYAPKVKDGDPKDRNNFKPYQDELYEPSIERNPKAKKVRVVDHKTEEEKLNKLLKYDEGDSSPSSFKEDVKRYIDLLM
jgi:hypothetical protein